MGELKSVLIIDDHPLTREGLSIAVRAAATGAQIVSLDSIDEAVTRLETRDFALVLLDFQLPGVDGFSGLLRIQHAAPSVPVAIVSSHEEPSLVEAARALGAIGFLFKSAPLDELAQRIATLLSGKPVFARASGSAAGIAALRAKLDTLSKAQFAVLLALVDGRSNKQIAFDLAISEATVKAHLSTVFRKLGVTNRTQALIAVGPILVPGSGEKR